MFLKITYFWYSRFNISANWNNICIDNWSTLSKLENFLLFLDYTIMLVLKKFKQNILNIIQTLFKLNFNYLCYHNNIVLYYLFSIIYCLLFILYYSMNSCNASIFKFGGKLTKIIIILAHNFTEHCAKYPGCKCWKYIVDNILSQFLTL